MSRRSSAAPVAIGNTARIPFVCTAGTEAPSAPTGTPSYIVRDAAGLGTGANLLSGSAAAISGQTTDFYISPVMSAGNGFVAGETYYATITYVISAVTYRDYVDIPVV